ncbi:MAG: NAD(P)/FAD-dependent oxidoreductase, partial [Bdellovibrionales bacterium]|nr:NAD(P)/FAD-dependent oxidoreductase [Bdellovibrionales bacterium]
MNAKRADKKNYDWISLGGGAAGYYGALHFAQLCPLSHCMIIEASSKTLRKVKISGGGRCNLTHSCFEPSKLSSFYPRGQKELISLFHKHGPRETLQWFAQRGVPTKTEEDGRIFPISNKSQSVIDCLEKERKKLQVS